MLCDVIVGVNEKVLKLEGLLKVSAVEDLRNVMCASDEVKWGCGRGEGWIGGSPVSSGAQL